jgi:hypothetical protein
MPMIDAAGSPATLLNRIAYYYPGIIIEMFRYG